LGQQGKNKAAQTSWELYAAKVRQQSKVEDKRTTNRAATPTNY
jgi:hypothetical protein